MKRTACFDLTGMIDKITNDIGHLLKNDQFGWFLNGSATPLLRKGESFHFVSKAEIKRYEYSNEKINGRPIRNDDDGYAILSDIKEQGLILDKNMRMVFRFDPSFSMNLLTKQPGCLYSALRFAEALVSDTVVQCSKFTTISIDLRDFHSCFDLTSFEKETGGDLTSVVSDIRHIVERQFENHDHWLVQIVNFIALGDEDCVYETRCVGNTYLLTEKENKRASQFQKWELYGILDKVIEYADNLVREKDAEVQLKMY